MSKITKLLLLVVPLLCVSGVYAISNWQLADVNSDKIVNSLDLVQALVYHGCPDNCWYANPRISNPPVPTSPPASQSFTNCQDSKMGANLMNLDEFPENNGPEMVELAREGLGGFVGALNCTMTKDFFPSFDASFWTKATICNKLDCLRERVNPAKGSACYGVDYEYLGYGPERKGGVPVSEWKNLSESVKEARKIVDARGKKLVLSFSTRQLHQDAFENAKYNNNWNNIEAVIADLAPYADMWIIQAADEYNNPGDNAFGAILSQRHFSPDDPRWREYTKRVVDALHKANPKIKILIQLALHRIPTQENPPGGQDQYPSAQLLLRYREKVVDLVDGVLASSFYSWSVCGGKEKCSSTCPNNCNPPGHVVADLEL